MLASFRSSIRQNVISTSVRWMSSSSSEVKLSPDFNTNKSEHNSFKEPEWNHQVQPPNIMSIVEQISQLKLHEVATLNEILKRELKIPDVQRVAAGPMAPDQGDGESELKGGTKSAYSVKLVKFDDSKKVALIKEIKKLVPGINLVEAKRFVEECPKVIGSNLSKDEAEALQKQLEAAGGSVKLE